METKWPPVRWFLRPILQRVYELIIEILRKLCCKRIQMTLSGQNLHIVWQLSCHGVGNIVTQWDDYYVGKSNMIFFYKILILSSEGLCEMDPLMALYVTWSKVVTNNNSCYSDQLSLWLTAVHLPTFSIPNNFFLYQVNVVRTLLYSQKSYLDSKVHGANMGPT